MDASGAGTKLLAPGSMDAKVPRSQAPRAQVSHHPPVSAFHLCHPGVGVDLSAAEQPRPHFNGLSVDVVREGVWTLTVDRWRETYHLNAPSLCMRLLPVPGVEWTGIVLITCAQSSLEAKLEFHPRIMPGTQQHSVSGVIRCVPNYVPASTLQPLSDATTLVALPQ